MAWVTEYDMTWHSEDFTGGIYLQRDGGTYQMPLLLRRDSLELKDTLPSWEDPIVRKNCSFTIVNNESNFYTLLPLMTISQGQIRVIVYMEYPSLGDVVIFEGFLNCEAVSQKMIYDADIQLTASGLVNKLEWATPDSIDTVQDMSLIDIIADCLALTGADYDIRVWCPLYEASATLGSGDSAFNLTAVSTELFWIDNIERVSALDILKQILSAMNCYLYWHRGVWCIIHYEMLGALSASYVEYTSGTSYDFDTPGTSYGPYTRDQKDVHTPTTMPQIANTQILSVTPGMRQLDIKLDQQQYFNQMNGDLSNIVRSNVNQTWVPLRTWHALYGGWDSIWPGWPQRSIANSISRVGTYDIVSDDGVLNGLTTHFKVTVHSDTVLTIKWKIFVRNGPDPYETYFWSDAKYMKVVFNWYLKVVDGDYLRYTEATDSWLTHAVMIPNTLTIRGTDFDPKLRLYEGQFVVPIGEKLAPSSADPEDVSLIFRMGTELVTDEGSATWTDQPMDWVYYGDFHAAVDAIPEDNLLEGEVVTDFLDQKSITMKLFDGGWNYRNSLKRASTGVVSPTWSELTKSWTLDGVNFDTLARKLLECKFRLYRTARQKIDVKYKTRSSAVAYNEWCPLGLFYDNKQSDKKFIVTHQSRKPESDLIAVTLWEYDDDETITLI